MKHSFVFPMLRDIPELRCNGTCLSVFRLHEGTTFLGEVLLHPASGLNGRATEVMCPFPAVQIAEIPRLIWIHHKWVELAGQRFYFLYVATVILQENAGVVLSY